MERRHDGRRHGRAPAAANDVLNALRGRLAAAAGTDRPLYVTRGETTPSGVEAVLTDVASGTLLLVR